ncbi:MULTISPECIES: hypothetical protein [Brevundimonas]|uniref:hypothetical protein n=1 Tax=Brevundimonas TaxID=41275 RepID=UPI000F02FE8B|nr:hypothetical protein [Brevundimonas lutea]
MKTVLKIAAATALVASLSACGYSMEQRAATGALAGAAAGQAIGGDTGSTVAGAVLGGAAGAATTPR